MNQRNAHTAMTTTIARFTVEKNTEFRASSTMSSRILSISRKSTFRLIDSLRSSFVGFLPASFLRCSAI